MAWKFWSFEFGKFEFVSDFDIRISNFFLYCDLTVFWGQIFCLTGGFNFNNDSLGS